MHFDLFCIIFNKKVSGRAAHEVPTQSKQLSEWWVNFRNDLSRPHCLNSRLLLFLLTVFAFKQPGQIVAADNGGNVGKIESAFTLTEYSLTTPL